MMLVVSRFSSFRKAAASLGINVSTLLRHVEKLEADLGAKAVDRLPEGFALTDTGTRIVKIAEEMHRQFTRLRDISDTDQLPRGDVKIAITEGLGSFWLAPKIPQFCLVNPDIVIDLHSSMDVIDILRNNADVSIQFKRPSNPDLIISKLCNLHVYPFASVSYIEKKGVPKLDGNVNEHRIVVQNSEQIPRSMLENVLRDIDTDRLISFKTNSSLSHLYAIERGLGIGGLPTFAMALGATLIPVDIGIQNTLDVWLSYKKENRNIKRISLVIEWLRSIFNPRKYPWFSPEFIHPAKIATMIKKHGSGGELFDSILLKEIIEGDNEFIYGFKRAVGRPKTSS